MNRWISVRVFKTIFHGSGEILHNKLNAHGGSTPAAVAPPMR
jgi:hypothetical protein